jgi:putative hydrolase
LSGARGLEVRVDLHVHSVASGHAYSTVKEIAEAAAEKGLEAFALADHGPALPGGAHLFHFWNMRVIPRSMCGVWVLRSAEVNIVDAQGGLDLPDPALQKLDLVLAGFHPGCGYESGTVEDNTRALLGALRHPLVDVIAHPGNPNFPVDLARLAEAAREEGKALEINNASYVYTRAGSRENDLALAREVAGRGGFLAVGSDAHIASFAGEFGHAIEIIEEAGVPGDSVVNRDMGRLRSFLEGRGKPLSLEETAAGRDRY